MFGIRDIRRNVSPKFIEICSGRSREGARPSLPLIFRPSWRKCFFGDRATTYLRVWMKRKKKETFKNNLPFSQCSPVKPEGHIHRYFLSVNPDWQVLLLSQRALSQALFKEKKSPDQVWFVAEDTPNLHDRASTINYKMKMTIMMRIMMMTMIIIDNRELKQRKRQKSK